MTRAKYPVKLNRFTNWRELSQILRTKSIELRDTSGWDDKNDINVIKEYESIKAKRFL